MRTMNEEMILILLTILRMDADRWGSTHVSESVFNRIRNVLTRAKRLPKTFYDMPGE